jgi:hypothetical protein
MPNAAQPAASLSPSPSPGAAAQPKAFARELDRAALAQGRDTQRSGEGQDQGGGASAGDVQDAAASDDLIDTRAEASRRAHKLRPANRAPSHPIRLPGDLHGVSADAPADATARADTGLAAVGADPRQQGDAASPVQLGISALMPASTRTAHDPLVAQARDHDSATDALAQQAPSDSRSDNAAGAVDPRAAAQTAALLAGASDAATRPVREAVKANGADALELAANPRATVLPAAMAKAALADPQTGAAGVTGLAPMVAAAPASAVPATTFQAELAAAVGSDAFAPALGAQLSTLIRDGISQARLTLHPAELGPIAVHIRLDGEMAQVDFSAVHALTRQALEDAVPALASALRESGLTLSGGGVFEQPREARDPRERMPDTPQRSRGGHADGTSASGAQSLPAAEVMHRARGRGVVDLYA